MNLNELKTAWQDYSHKIKITQAINEKIILRMIRDRSTSRLARIQQEYRLSFIYMFIMLLLFLSILIWNPFDFTQIVQYTPTMIQTACMLVFLFVLFNGYKNLQVDMNRNNLDIALKKVIAVYEKAEKVLGWAGVSLFASGLLFPLSFLPRAIKSSGLKQGLGVVIIQIAVMLVLYLLAAKFGFLKDRKKHANKFKEDLNELEELRSISAELQS